MGSGSEGEEEEEVVVDMKSGHAGFADAMKKLLQRSVGSDKAPVLAKRHTAAEKLAAAERQAAAAAKAASSEKGRRRRAHLLAPSTEPNVVLEKALRRVATVGGKGGAGPGGWAAPHSALRVWCPAVVTLFNAIKVQQAAMGVGDASKAADPADDAERKRASGVKQLPKESFLTLLKKASTKGAADEDAEPPSDKTPSRAGAGGAGTGAALPASKRKWAVLDDDFMVGGDGSDSDGASPAGGHSDDSGDDSGGDSDE